MTSSEIT